MARPRLFGLNQAAVEVGDVKEALSCA